MNSDKDVFISYSHIDDQPVEEGKPGWVADFHRHLATRLNKIRGQECQIWRDPSLQGNDVLAPALEGQLRDVKALVSVLTPRYVKSAWCRRELTTFLQAVESRGGLQVGEQARWFKVLKTPIEKDDLPTDFPREIHDLVENLVGYSFFDVDPQSRRPREYSREFGPQAEQLYHAKIYDLAWDLSHLLKRVEAVEASKPAVGRESKTVYLATATADLRSERDQIRRELLDRGHVVLGDTPLPLVYSELQSALREILKSCDLSLHFAGSVYGLIPEGTTQSLPQIQHAIAAEIAAQGRLRTLIRLPRLDATLEPRQAEFLRCLREDDTAPQNTELVEGAFEHFKEVLLDALRPPPPLATPQRSVPPAVGRANPPLLYLMGDRSDMEMMDRVDDFFYERGLEVTRPSYDGVEDDLAAAHRRRLVECDAALILYGKVSRDWVDMKLMDLAQARGYGRDRDYRATAVCIAPPGDRSKERFRTRTVDLLQFDGQHTDTLQSIVEKLHGNN